MAVVLGLDPRLYLKDKAKLLPSDRYKTISDLVRLIEIAKTEKIKYLYNGHFDYSLPENVTNIMLDVEDDFAFIALMANNQFEYTEKVYSYLPVNGDDIVCSFDEVTNSYIAGLLKELIDTYYHGILMSDRCINMQINGENYNFVNNISENYDLEIEMLPAITDNNEFETHFALYHWFYGRENKDIILTDTFIKQISRVNNNELFIILTSMFRGIYYPDYKCKNGAQRTKNTIEAHSDKHADCMEINNKEATLYRIHCVEIKENSGGKKRIFYTDKNGYTFVFYYDPEHEEKFSHYEKIINPKIRRYRYNETLSGAEFALKAMKK